MLLSREPNCCRPPVSFIATWALSLGQFAFRCNAFILFTRTFDAIFELAPIMRELFGHFVDPAWHIATNHRREGYPLTDMEFMRGHRAHLLAGSTAPRRDSEPGT